MPRIRACKGDFLQSIEGRRRNCWRSSGASPWRFPRFSGLRGVGWCTALDLRNSQLVRQLRLLSRFGTQLQKSCSKAIPKMSDVKLLDPEGRNSHLRSPRPSPATAHSSIQACSARGRPRILRTCSKWAT